MTRREEALVAHATPQDGKQGGRRLQGRVRTGSPEHSDNHSAGAQMRLQRTVSHG
jgi:hypothetical protein